MIRVGTFCTGIGSPEFALEDTEHELVFACEIDKFARASFLSRFKPNIMLQDMTKVDWDNPALSTNIVIAGLPCQAFSIAGKRLGEQDKRGILIYDFYKYLKVHQPEVFILENVKGLKSINKGEIFLNWQRILGCSVNGKVIEEPHPETLGYNLHWKVLNTKNFDLPQNRERVFIVGIRSDIPDVYEFPENRLLKLRLRDMLEESVHEKYYLSEQLISSFLKHADRHNEKGTGFACKPKTEDDIANCIRANAALCPTDNILIEKLIPFGNSQDTKLSPLDGCSQTLSAGHFNQPKILVKTATKQGYEAAAAGDSINFSQPNSETRRGRVGHQIANTLDTACNQAIVLEVVANTDSVNEMRGRVYGDNGLSPTITAKQGGGHEPLVRVDAWRENENTISGYKNDGRNSGVQEAVFHKPDGILSTLGTTHTPKILGHRIRRLTPLECWRLQGFSDEYFYQAQHNSKVEGKKNKGMSDTQLYKQAGNSISNTVIKAVLQPAIALIESMDIL